MTTPPDRLAAALTGHYRIERALGQGGMATVYLTSGSTHDRQVAIEVLKPELAAGLGAERFVHEIETTAALSYHHDRSARAEPIVVVANWFDEIRRKVPR